MDPRLNPYSPGAGTPPPELAGRDEVIEKASIALDRIRAGRSARSMILYGLRGVGKTVLLNHIRLQAESAGFTTANIEASEGRSLPSLLVPVLRSALIKLDRIVATRSGIERAMRSLASFARTLKVKYNDIEFGLEIPSELGSADSGILENDISDLVAVIGQAAADRKTAVVVFIDELQYIPEDQIAALIASLHAASQRQLPITVIGAGLPQVLGRMGKAKSYAERLFEFCSIDRLEEVDARAALTVPAIEQGIRFEEAAVRTILQQTQGYPYFLQEWGKHSWAIATQSPITLANAEEATASALAELDESFFRVRFDRLTPSEKRYIRAMAELGPGEHRSGEIADILGQKVTSVAPTRSNLIEKGMIYSMAHGATAFTVPLFEGFMRRIMPGLD